MIILCKFWLEFVTNYFSLDLKFFTSNILKNISFVEILKVEMIFLLLLIFWISNFDEGPYVSILSYNQVRVSKYIQGACD